MHAERPGGVAIAGSAHGRDSVLTDEFVRKYQPMLHRYLLAHTQNRETADDLSQETWARIFERAAQYRGDSEFSGWAIAIAHHLVIDEGRKAQRRRFIPCEESLCLPAVCSTLLSPYELACRAEAARRLRRAVGTLTPRLQAVIRLRFGEGLALSDIARRLRIAPGTVRSRLNRGVAALKSGVGRRECQSIAAM